MRPMHKRSVLFGAMVLTSSHVISQLVGFAYRVGLSRLIDPEGMGLFQLIMPVYSVLLSLTASGVTTAVSRMTAGYGALGNTRAVGQTVRWALVWFLCALGVICLLVIPFSDGISVWLLNDARTRLGLLLLLPCLLFTGMENIYKNYFYGAQHVMPPAITEVAEMLIRAAAVLTLLTVVRPPHRELAVGLIIAGMIVCEIASSTLLLIFYRRHRRMSVPEQGKALPRRVLLGQMSSIAVPMIGASVAANLLAAANTVIIPARLIVSGLKPEAALSAYGVAFGMTMPLLWLPQVPVTALALIIMPRVAECAATHDRIRLARLVRQCIRWTALLMIPACALLIPFGTPLARFLFRQQTAGQYMTPLAVASVFMAFQSVLGSLLTGMGSQDRAAANIIVTDILQLVLTWLLVALPDVRLSGFVLAYLVTTAAGAALNAWDVRKGLQSA